MEQKVTNSEDPYTASFVVFIIGTILTGLSLVTPMIDVNLLIFKIKSYKAADILDTAPYALIILSFLLSLAICIFIRRFDLKIIQILAVAAVLCVVYPYFEINSIIDQYQTELPQELKDDVVNEIYTVDKGIAVYSLIGGAVLNIIGFFLTFQIKGEIEKGPSSQQDNSDFVREENLEMQSSPREIIGYDTQTGEPIYKKD